MGVSVFNCVSNALDMLKFSSENLLGTAGHPLDYIVVHWNSGHEVLCYLQYLQDQHAYPKSGSKIHLVPYTTDDTIGFVPNLRKMINHGFDEGFKLNDYCGLVNTDQAFAPGWLANMVPHLDPDKLIIARMVESGRMPSSHETHDFGDTTHEAFKLEDFVRWAGDNGKSTTTAISRGIGMPYFLHSRQWDRHGPWDCIASTEGTGAPDQRFFWSMRDAGVPWIRVENAITYHVGAVERTKPNNIAFEQLPYEGLA